VFAAVSYYLYSRTVQLEKKVGLMENILLDLKVTTEQTLLSATESAEHVSESDVESEAQTQTHIQTQPLVSGNYKSLEAEEQTAVVATKVEAPSEPAEERATVSLNYESMTYKELVQLGKQRGISGLRNMSKAQVIEALRAASGSSAGGLLSSWTASDAEVTPLDQLKSAQDGSFTGLSSLDAIGSEKSDELNLGDFTELVGSN
jgi:hypothetical protein